MLSSFAKALTFSSVSGLGVEKGPRGGSQKSWQEHCFPVFVSSFPTMLCSEMVDGSGFSVSDWDGKSSISWNSKRH